MLETFVIDFAVAFMLLFIYAGNMKYFISSCDRSDY